MSSIGRESISDIRTVKAHANEEMTFLRFATINQSVFEVGRARGYYWAIYFFGYKAMDHLSSLAIIYLVARTYESLNLTIGEVAAVMLYVRAVMNNAGAVTNNIQNVFKVFGASYEIALLIVSQSKVKHTGKLQPNQDSEETNDMHI